MAEEVEARGRPVGTEEVGGVSLRLPALEVPSWEELYKMCLSLADNIRESGYRPDIIVGVARGGWVVGRVLSDLLGVKETANVRVEFYEEVGKPGKTPRITQEVSVDVKGKKVLVADDVADTGMSLRAVIDHLRERGASEVRTATLYVKPWSVVTPDYSVKRTEKWIVFAWERYESYADLRRKAGELGMGEGEFEDYLVKSGFPKGLLKKFREWSG